MPAEGPWSDLALHTIGWKAFQNLCADVCEHTFGGPVEVYEEAKDGGQDAVLTLQSSTGKTTIGTVQCKHSVKASRALTIGDLTSEFAKVDILVQQGLADVYVLMTNMAVRAPIAATIKTQLLKRGVRKAHVLGKQFLLRRIRGSSELRAMIPQVYGLGDLSTILDERLREQTRVLLGDWAPKLKAYVPTSAHQSAVRALMDHKVVLLLGNPSTGKSVLGAVLSTIASENPDHTVLYLTSPRDFEDRWNPHEQGRFFWIDDAFGSNSVRDEYIHDWASAFKKVQVAIKHGNRFLLTSRRHIYEAARSRLGDSNLSEFADKRAIVDVGGLSLDEKRQILYNHIAHGTQTGSWKRAVKVHLDAIAEVPEFLPGIAERLGNPAFTRGLGVSQSELVRFMEEPKEHLINTINALDRGHRATLLLIYVYQGALPETDWGDEQVGVVTQLTGVDRADLNEGLLELRGSFVRTRTINGVTTWGFDHPTIADALTSILKDNRAMIEALVRGASHYTLLSGFASDGTVTETDVPTIPASLNHVFVSRLAGTPDEGPVNRHLFHFLAYRASEDVFRQLLQAEPNLLSRDSWHYGPVAEDPRVLVHARAHSWGLLPDDVRDDSASNLERAAQRFDFSFVDNDDILALVPPTRLLALGVRLHGEVLPTVSEAIEEVADDADLDEDPSSHFDRFIDGMEKLQSLVGVDDLLSGAVTAMNGAIDQAVERLSDAQHERKREDHTDWEYMTHTPARAESPAPVTGGDGERSVFADVDGDIE